MSSSFDSRSTAGALPRAPTRTGHERSLERVLEQEHIPGLDFLRAVAVLLVMMGHALESVSLIDSGSSLGVELFFLLSGFLITLLLLREHARTGTIALGRFYWRRAARLLPGFYLYMLVGMVSLMLHHSSIPWGAVAASIFYVVNYFQAFTGAATHFLSHCWSLAVEEQFYLLWPPVLLWLLESGRMPGKVLLYTVLAIWLYRWILLIGTYNTDYLYRALETRGDHLALGCLAAVLTRSARVRRAVDRIGALGTLICLAALFVCIDQDNASGVFKYAVGYVIEPVLLAVLMLATIRAASGDGWLARCLNQPLMVHIGKVSYGMYLFHGMVMFTTQRIVEEHTGSMALALLAAVAATVLVATVSFRWFESPVRAWLNARAPRRT